MVNKIRRGDHINWNQVFYFSEIAAASSIKGAAEKLNLSPSTLSEHLGQLEMDLNVKLFHRQHRKLMLTREGARLYHSARQMFESGKRFIDVISPTPLGCYPISIGLVPGSSYAFAHSIISDYVLRHEDVSAHILRYKHDEMETALLESKLDFGFTDRRSERRNIVQTPVVATELRFFVSADLPKRDLKDHLTRLPLVVCRSERSGPSLVEEVLENLDMKPKSIIVSEFPSLVENLCRKGAGVAVLGRLHLERDPTVAILQLPKDFPDLTERLYATWVSDGENLEAVRRLLPLLGQAQSLTDPGTGFS